jgi:hypothetical protein
MQIVRRFSWWRIQCSSIKRGDKDETDSRDEKTYFSSSASFGDGVRGIYSCSLL